MVKKTNIFVVSLIALMSVNAGYATSVTKEYVDSQDGQFYNRIRTQDSRIALIRDWVNPQDEENGERATLTTTAQDAYRAINEVNAGLAAKANASDLAPVATSGSYNDLTDKPNIAAAQIQADWNQADNTATDFIKNKPTIPTVPTNVSAFTNDAGYLTEHQSLANYPTNAEMQAAIAAVQSGNTVDLSAYETTAHAESTYQQKNLVTVTSGEDIESYANSTTKYPSMATTNAMIDNALSLMNDNLSDVDDVMVRHTKEVPVGSATVPVYVAADGTATPITSYSGKAATAGVADSANAVAWGNVTGKPTINGESMDSNVVLDAADVGAVASNQTTKGGVLTTNADTGDVQVSSTIATDKVAGLSAVTTAVPGNKDGTFVLTATVTNGVASYHWEDVGR